jgi:hypothetical protein
VLRETRPPVSPICCPPLPSTPFQFTVSGHIAAAAQPIPSASAGNGRCKPTAHGALPPLPQSNEPKLEKKQQKKEKQKATRLEVKARKTKKGNDSDGSSSSSTASSPGLESDNAAVRQQTIVVKADARDTDHEREGEDEDELVLLKLNKLKSLSRSLVSVMLEIGTPLTINFSIPVVRRAHSGHTIPLLGTVEDIQVELTELTTLEEAVDLAKTIRSLKDVPHTTRHDTTRHDTTRHDTTRHDTCLWWLEAHTTRVDRKWWRFGLARRCTR